MEHIESITKFLGGTKTFRRAPASDRDFVAIVRKGIPVRAVSAAAKSLSVTEEQAFTWLKISSRTAARRKANDEPLRDVESERLLRLARLVAKATEVLGDRAKAVHWLANPNRALESDAPIEVLDTDIGFQHAFDVLRRVEHGVIS